MSDRSPALSLGGRLRRRRKSLGLTMAEVAADSGLTVGFISQIEREISRPSLPSLYAVARALGTSVDQFLSSAPQRDHTAVTRAETRPRFKFGGKEFEYEFLEPGFAEALLNGCITHYPPGASSDLARHEGEDFVYLIAGEMLYTVGDREYRLKAGDTLHFPSGILHSNRNVGTEVAIELWIGTMRLFSEDAAEDTAGNGAGREAATAPVRRVPPRNHPAGQGLPKKTPVVEPGAEDAIGRRRTRGAGAAPVHVTVNPSRENSDAND